MSLSLDDKKDLAEIIASALKPPPKKETDLPDMAFKLISTLSMAMIVWIFSSVNELKQDVGIIKSNNDHTSKSLQEVRAFTKEPRFTKDNFEDAITPIINNINKNTLELNSRNQFMKDVENRLITLEIIAKDKKK